MRFRIREAALAFAGAGAIAASSHAALIVFNTPAGSTTGGQPVDAKATFTTGNGTVSLLLENLLADPTSVVQCISGVFFELDGGQAGGTLDSSSGIERTVNADKTFTDGGAAATGWSFDNDPPAVLNVLGTPTAPEHVIIGPAGNLNLYNNANGSIAGNDAHNPFMGLSATFNMSIPGVTASTVVTSVTFQFNTSPGNTVTVPEPATMALVTLALPLLRRRRA